MYTTMNIEVGTLNVMSDKQSFADWLANTLNHRGWSQADLHRVTGLSRAAVSNYCNGFRIPDKEAMLSIAAALDYSPETLYRVAGILPDRDSDVMNEKGDLLVNLIKKLSDRDLEELIALARAKLRHYGESNNDDNREGKSRDGAGGAYSPDALD